MFVHSSLLREVVSSLFYIWGAGNIKRLYVRSWEKHYVDKIDKLGFSDLSSSAFQRGHTESDRRAWIFGKGPQEIYTIEETGGIV